VTESPSPTSTQRERWFSWGAWSIAVGIVLVAVYLGWQIVSTPIVTPEALTALEPSAAEPASFSESGQLALPEWQPPQISFEVVRLANIHTTIPTRPREQVLTYTIDTGDSIFAVAKTYGLKPETVLWANYDQLNDNPDMLSVGMKLLIPPLDGVLYRWASGDTIEAVASAFTAIPDDILSWPGNRIDLTNPLIHPGTLVMIPGGHREFRQWVVPTIPRGRAGVSTSLLGPGACSGSYDGAYGSGTFIWPAANHYLSGNDYWSGHLGIDIAAGQGASIFAADSGVVVFAGGAYGGYGNMVMIDHGNDYQTLYAHLNSVFTSCGASVSQGQRIASAGNTGNSTGPHLHFEVRYQGGFVNPWFVLPAP
jgi:murein DD-endopeptidase MepM/ murein hydrolase activator NlpD